MAIVMARLGIGKTIFGCKFNLYFLVHCSKAFVAVESMFVNGCLSNKESTNKPISFVVNFVNGCSVLAPRNVRHDASSFAAILLQGLYGIYT